MGLFDWFKDSEPDEGLIEVSNDEGDHWVISTPSEETEGVLGWLFGAGVREETSRGEQTYYRDNDRGWAETRDSHEYRAHGERVVDEYEDNEDSYDREDDRSDFDLQDGYAEEDEHSAERWWSWW